MKIPLGQAGNDVATPRLTPTAHADTRIADAVGRIGQDISREAESLVDTDMAAAIKSRQIKMATAAKEIESRNLTDDEEIKKAGAEILTKTPPAEVKGMNARQLQAYNNANKLADEGFQAGIADIQMAAKATRAQNSIGTLMQGAELEVANGIDPSAASAFLSSPVLNLS